jgi:hypothetical protein
MALSQFPAKMNAAVPTVLAAGTTLRYLRDTSGDLTWRSLNEVQQALDAAGNACFAALVEGQKAPASATDYLVGLGGPATLQDMAIGIQAAKDAATAWNIMLTDWLATLPPSALITTVVRKTGVASMHFENAHFIPADLALPLRNAPELAALIAAFENVGA